MSSVDLRVVPSRITVAAPLAQRKAQRTTFFSVLGSILGGFVLTGIFLALSAAVFVLVGVYGFIDFAKLY
jgi:hypothetical protein